VAALEQRDPHWRSYALYTLVTVILYIALLFASIWQWGFYLFLANVLAWIELMALHLQSTAETPSVSAPRAR
jgi:cobalamin synthase